MFLDVIGYFMILSNFIISAFLGLYLCLSLIDIYNKSSACKSTAFIINIIMQIEYKLYLDYSL